MRRILDAGSADALALAARAVAAGELIVVPTDTVYGIAARLDRPAGLAALFEAKARPSSLTLPVLVSGLDQAEAIGVVDGRAGALARAFWPGPLTIVVARRADLEADLGGDGATVGLRVPDRAETLSLLRLTGPLATSSANRSGEPTPPDAPAIAALFGDAVAIYLDGGPASDPLASTVVSTLGDTVSLLREGALAFAEIRRGLAG